MKRITWKRAQWGSVGYVNGVRVFSVSWGINGKPSQPYTLEATLPGISKSYHTQESDAQNMAETVLMLCIEGLGATFDGGN